MTASIFAGALALVSVTTAAPAGAVDAVNDAQFRAAWANPSTTRIDLTGNIDVDCTLFPTAVLTGASAYSRSSNGDITVDGHGLTINANCPGDGIQVLFSGGTGTVTLDNVTVSGGDYFHNGSVGGGGFQANGDVILDHATIRNNAVTSTGAGGAFGVSGAGVFVSGTVTARNSAFANNQASCAVCGGAQGGGIWAGDVVLVNSTVSNNSAVAPGGVGFGGGIHTPPGGRTELIYTTIADNSSVVASNVNTSSFESFGSVIANPVASVENCTFNGGTQQSHGYNYEENANSCAFTGTGDVPTGADPALVALANNGGPTQTRLPGALLIDKIPLASCETDGALGVIDDQRGFRRPEFSDGICDIGAVESQAAGTPGTFHSIQPTRILDTRIDQGLTDAFLPQQTRDLTVTDVGGLPSNGIEAVLMNVTITGPTANGWLTLFPKGAPLPTASNLNFVAGQTVPNLVTVRVGYGDPPGGKVSINNTGGNPGAGSVDVIADVVGYYLDTTPSPEGRFTGLTPTRLLDTRLDQGIVDAIPPQTTKYLDVVDGGPGGVPITADAVVLNITATGGSAYGWLTLFPEGQPLPTAANLNYFPGQTVANLVTVKIGGAGGSISIDNSTGNAAAGSVHVIGDLVGYYDSTGGSILTTMAPQRILDTRLGTGGVTGPVAPNATITVDPKTATGLPAVGSYTAVIVNVAVTQPSAYGWLSVFPSGQITPNAANLNFVAGQTVPNLVKIAVGPDGKIHIANTDFPGPPPPSGTVHIVVDIVGYYT